MADEELEEMEEEQETEVEEKTSENKIELDFNMDSIERLKIEVANVDDPNSKTIGNYLLEQFAKDEPLKNAYKERKITLKAVVDFVIECARKQLNSKNGMIADNVVFGWVLHYVQDEKVEITGEATYKLNELDKDAAKKRAIAQYEAEELAKIKKAEQKKVEAEKRKLEKELAKEKESGQMNLFGDF